MRKFMKNQGLLSRHRRTGETGFTLVELLIATVIFGIISAAIFSLMAQNQPIFNQQQNLAEVNIALRNAVAQMQLDIANAGANYYTGANIPNYPVGVTVTNNVVASGGDCRSGTPLQYGANCFDAMSIITADKSTPPANPMSSASGCINTNTATSGSNGTAYLAPSGSVTGYGTGATAPAAATAAAANYLSGDQILFINANGSQYTTAKLASAGGTAKIGTFWYVLLTYGTTNASGTNSAANDPYSMSTNANSMLGNTFCSTDWVLRILPITYQVDISTPTNPVLTRSVAGLAQTLAQKTLATQIVGFKIGASLFNSTTDQESTVYCFNAQAYDPNCPTVAAGTNGTWSYNYTFLRSVMVSLIGRTPPTTSNTYVFRNSFDNGPYEIQGVSVVINPRNMSMTD
jgi:prepilin-type N-terminal cleavage/methylation domain-containing protein